LLSGEEERQRGEEEGKIRDRDKESLNVKEREGRQRREKGKRQREFGKFNVYQMKDVPSCVFHSLCRICSPRRY